MWDDSGLSELGALLDGETTENQDEVTDAFLP
jgi:hypothetical protein